MLLRVINVWLLRVINVWLLRVINLSKELTSNSTIIILP